ncbi:MAG TPA: hypothetical protein P5168_05805, partial [Candidatus Methanomethylicus sp.]|nr:hypothetical protein [Candidatus Methanomethylicus sp.]
WAWMEDTLKAMFSQRKRTLRKALGTYCKIKRIGAPHLPGIGEELMSRRVFELSPRDFMSIAEELSRIEGNRLGV